MHVAKNNETPRGLVSLAGIILTLSLSTVLLLLLVKSSKLLRATDSMRKSILSYSILEMYLRQIKSTSDAQGFKIPARIHQKGMITLSNGELLNISKSPMLLSDQLSDAISWVEVNFNLVMKATNQGEDSSTLKLEGCYILQNKARLAADYRSFLVISHDGIFEALEYAPHQTTATPCLELNLAIQESVIADKRQDFFLPGVRFLVPIERINTLYRDTEGRLRLISNVSASIVENQPLREDFPFFRFRYYQETNTVQTLSVQIISADNMLKSTSFSIDFQGNQFSYLNLFEYLS